MKVQPQFLSYENWFYHLWHLTDHMETVKDMRRYADFCDPETQIASGETLARRGAGKLKN